MGTRRSRHEVWTLRFHALTALERHMIDHGCATGPDTTDKVSLATSAAGYAQDEDGWAGTAQADWAEARDDLAAVECPTAARMLATTARAMRS